MKLPVNRKKEGSSFWALLAAFAIPFFFMLTVMIIGGYQPFGKLSMLYSDMYHQYYPFWLNFRNTLRSGDSLLYTWSMGMGMDHLSLISYYLASPLNLLSVFVPDSFTLGFYSLLVPLKLGLAGLFFAVFLRNTFDKTDFSISLFGGLYGLCAWALGYQWNVMWLDTFALLPLLALGTVSLLSEKKSFLYTVTLFLSVFSNYYIGFFSCIFVFLLFVCYQICKWQGFKKFCFDFIRIGIYTVIAIGMTAVLILPALRGLQNTQSSVNSFPTGFRLNMTAEHNLKGLFSAMIQVASNSMGGLEPTFKEGLPNLYCGVIAVLLGILYLTNKNISLKEKLCCIFLLIFFNISFIIRQLDYIWHGFHFTNMIPYRFSFLYSFVLLFMAYRAYLLRSDFRLWQIILSGIVAVVLILCSENRSDWTFIAYNVGFLVLYLVLMILDLPDQSKDFFIKDGLSKRSAVLCYITWGVIFLELAMNILNFGLRFPPTGISNYPKGTIHSAALIQQMKDTDQELFYRTETSHSQTLNDGAINHYHGISTFTSSANVKVTKYMMALGYGAKETYNRYCYEDGSPVANMFLNQKYMLERSGKVLDNSYMDATYYSGDIYLLKNNLYLPLGFLVHPDLAHLEFYNGDPFQFQNQLFASATGISDPVWYQLPPAAITGESVIITAQDQNYCSYEDAESDSFIRYDFVADRDGYVCLYFDVTERNSYHVYHNNEELYSESLSLPQMIGACDVIEGDIISIELSCDSGESGTMTIKAGVIDEPVIRTGHQLLSMSPLNITSFSNTRIQGNVDCKYDGLLYTSIPQDGNWRCYVDGNEVSHETVGDVMIGLMMSKGYHDVAFEYHNPAFSYGWKISSIFACLYLLILLIQHSKGKGVFQK